MSDDLIAQREIGKSNRRLRQRAAAPDRRARAVVRKGIAPRKRCPLRSSRRFRAGGILRVREPERGGTLGFGIRLQAQHLLQLFDRARGIVRAKGRDRHPPEHIDATAARRRHLVEGAVDTQRFRRLSDADQIFGEQPRRALAIAERGARDLAAHDRPSTLLDVGRTPFTHIEPEERDEDVACFGAVGMLLEERVGAKARVVVGTQRIEMLNPRRLDFLAA